MKVSVVKSWKLGKYTVGVQQGHQRFTLGYVGDEKDCEWYAEMFRVALGKHDEEKKEKR